MLVSLTIKNFALIEKLAIDFSNGFSIITGETGAGKSILLGALGLVLGKRADLASLKNKEEKCVVEAQFSIATYNLQTFFEEYGFDYEEETIIRREILPSGKSRAFVNDSPVNLQELNKLGDYLLDIHSQHQTRELSEEAYQFQIIDTIAGTSNLLQEYTIGLKKHKLTVANLLKAKEQLSEALKEQDYNLYLLKELEEARLVTGEQEQLESIQEQLNNVELISENIAQVLYLSENEQYGILPNLKEFKNKLQRIQKFSPAYAAIYERIESLQIEIKDVVQEIQLLSETIVQDPKQLEFATQKLQLIYTLQKKHQVQTIDELLQIQNELQNKVVSVAAIENAIVILEAEIFSGTTQLDALAKTIHIKRKEAIPDLTLQLTSVLTQLGMSNAQFSIEVIATEHYYPNGKDMLNFLFSANKGSDFGLLKKVASGGEMSRIMLAIKSILAQYTQLPTIIFDEIDTGVSGEIADKMAIIMQQMSDKMQVLAITHLPQIAAKGTTHFKVYKTDSNEQTSSNLRQLNTEERVLELAQMLSGATITDSALNHARELLN